jgi:Glyoxalase/Bleomycin resistance protein/Dioxygenase superfamily
MIWIQVRDVRAEHARLIAAGVTIVREPVTEPWGLTEMWITDPDGVRIVLVEVPRQPPLRRDPPRPAAKVTNPARPGPGTYPRPASRFTSMTISGYRDSFGSFTGAPRRGCSSS